MLGRFFLYLKDKVSFDIVLQFQGAVIASNGNFHLLFLLNDISAVDGQDLAGDKFGVG